jgi:DNA-binding SARP family transcriptional activator
MVWTDVAAFGTLEQRWQQANGPAGLQTPATAMAVAERALQLSRGRLLAGESLAAGWLPQREQLASRVARLALGLGAALEAQGHWRDAAGIYEAGIVADPLAEPIHRALMRTQLQLGERAAALQTFGRCRDALAAAFGVEPATETRALHERARGAG